MKKFLTAALAALAALLLLSGCSQKVSPAEEMPETVPVPSQFSGSMNYGGEEIPYVSRFGSETEIQLSDTGITVNGGEETEAVFTSRDIIYYEDRVSYDSGNPYGEGEARDRHSQAEADAHTVVNITAPGAYRIRGKLSAGQIRVDLGEDAFSDEAAVVELILEDADITCTVAPAILFLNVYECDGNWSVETARAEVDTASAGANLILEGENTVSGSYVAKIYKDKEGEKKLWKQDGAIYSYMSMNVFGPGSLSLHASNEGLDTELHLTVNGGNIAIYSDNDGINTNEDGVSVTTINGGTLHITAGLGEEGDGIDSNGYLVINGGTVISSANPAADAGLDSDLGSYVNGGVVLALGSTMDWAESDSGQVTLNLQFAAQQSPDSALVVTREDGTVLFAYAPGEDEVLGSNQRRYLGAILSCPGLTQGSTCLVFTGGTLSGSEEQGLYSSVSAYSGGTQMQYSGTDLGGFGGGMGGMVPPEGFQGDRREPPEGMEPGQVPSSPEGFEGAPGEMPSFPDGEIPSFPDGEIPSFPDGEIPSEPGQDSRRDGGKNPGEQPPTQGSTRFLLADKVNAFSGVTAVP